MINADIFKKPFHNHSLDEVLKLYEIDDTKGFSRAESATRRQFFDYVAKGVPYGPDDCTSCAMGLGRLSAIRTGNRPAFAEPLYSPGKDDQI